MNKCISVSKKQYKKVSKDFQYLKMILEELGAPYEVQNMNIEDYASWNLPCEIASSWDNIDYFIDSLLDSCIIDEQVAELLKQIRDNFHNVSIKGNMYESDIWTHEALKSHMFWQQQRNLANETIRIISIITIISK